MIQRLGRFVCHAAAVFNGGMAYLNAYDGNRWMTLFCVFASAVCFWNLM